MIPRLPSGTPFLSRRGSERRIAGRSRVSFVISGVVRVDQATAVGMMGPAGGRAWFITIVAFATLLVVAGFRSAPSVLIMPLEMAFGWSRTQISLAVSINVLAYGLVSPFAAALMQRFGIRRVVMVALVIIASGAFATTAVSAPWQLDVLWGLVVGGGTGSMALVFSPTIASRWFVRRRGLVVGVLSAATSTGQLIFCRCSPTSLIITGGARCHSWWGDSRWSWCRSWPSSFGRAPRVGVPSRTARHLIGNHRFTRPVAPLGERWTRFDGRPASALFGYWPGHFSSVDSRRMA